MENNAHNNRISDKLGIHAAAPDAEVWNRISDQLDKDIVNDRRLWRGFLIWGSSTLILGAVALTAWMLRPQSELQRYAGLADRPQVEQLAVNGTETADNKYDMSLLGSDYVSEYDRA